MCDEGVCDEGVCVCSVLQNSSVLESHHWRCAVSLLRESGLLDHLPITDRSVPPSRQPTTTVNVLIEARVFIYTVYALIEALFI